MHAIDDCADRLHRAGWSVGEVRISTDAGALWLISGANGENLIYARASTQTAAWQEACQQARIVGMLRR